MCLCLSGQFILNFRFLMQVNSYKTVNLVSPYFTAGMSLKNYLYKLFY